MKSETKPAAQVPFARKAAALKASAIPSPPPLATANSQHRAKAALAPDPGHDQHDREITHGPHGPPPVVRLMSKREVLEIVGCSYPTLWQKMRAGTFPRSRQDGGRSVWLSTDIETWLKQLPVRPLKGDPVAIESPPSLNAL